MSDFPYEDHLADTMLGLGVDEVSELSPRVRVRKRMYSTSRLVPLWRWTPRWVQRWRFACHWAIVQEPRYELWVDDGEGDAYVSSIPIEVARLASVAVRDPDRIRLALVRTKLEDRLSATREANRRSRAEDAVMAGAFMVALCLGLGFVTHEPLAIAFAGAGLFVWLGFWSSRERRRNPF